MANVAIVRWQRKPSQQLLAESRAISVPVCLILFLTRSCQAPVCSALFIGGFHQRANVTRADADLGAREVAGSDYFDAATLRTATLITRSE